MNDVAPGKYIGTVTASALGVSGTGSEQLVIGFDVETPDGVVSMTWYGYFSEKSLDITTKALKAVGWDLAEHDFDLNPLSPSEPSETPIKGDQALLVIDYEVDQRDGSRRSKIKWVNDVSSSGLAVKERMEPTAAKAFTTGLRARLIAHAGPGGVKPKTTAPAARPAVRTPTSVPPRETPAPATPKPAPINEGVNFDDIPF